MSSQVKFIYQRETTLAFVRKPAYEKGGTCAREPLKCNVALSLPRPGNTVVAGGKTTTQPPEVGGHVSSHVCCSFTVAPETDDVIVASLAGHAPESISLSGRPERPIARKLTIGGAFGELWDSVYKSGTFCSAAVHVMGISA